MTLRERITSLMDCPVCCVTYSVKEMKSLRLPTNECPDCHNELKPHKKKKRKKKRGKK
jgi:hypothetical protein